MLIIDSTLITKMVLYKMPEGKNCSLLLRNIIAANTMTKSKTEPTIPPETIMITGRLMKKYIIAHIMGIVHASQLTSFLRF